MNPELKLHEEKMTKTISVLREELAAIRAGRANPPALTSWPRYLFRRLVHWSSSHTISLPLNPSRRPIKLLILVSNPITMVLSCAFCSHLSPKSAEKI